MLQTNLKEAETLPCPKGDTIRTKVCNIVKGLREEECKTYTVGDAAGSLVIDVWRQEIYSWNQQDRDCRKELLVIGGSKNEKGV